MKSAALRAAQRRRATAMLSLALSVAAAPLSAAGAQSRLLDSVDTFVKAEMARERVPGVAIAVISKGTVLTAKGYGFANLEHHVPVGPETIFQSGSMGKQFTSAAVMLLVEQGKIGLEDPLTKYFPDAPTSWQAITVHHLLTHTSGIPDYTGAVALDYRHDYTEDELARFAYKLKLEFPPGSRWNYSNTGYVLLGIIIHKATGKFYGDVLGERVFGPLGMNTTRIISEEDIVPNRAAGYRLDKGTLKNQEWVAPRLNTTADGSLYFSVRDLVAWDKGLRSKAILRAASWEKIFEPVRLNSGNRYPYGFGWSVDTAGGAAQLHHTGSWQGFKTGISRYLGEDLTVVVLANLAQADPMRFIDGIAGIMSPALAKTEPKPIADREPAVGGRLLALLAMTKEGRLSPAEFAYVRAGFFPEGAKAYQQRLATLGAPQKAVLLERKVLGDDRVYTYEVAWPAKTMIVTLGLAPDDKISEFSVRAK